MSKRTLALVLAMSMAGCAAKSPSQYTLNCEMGGNFEKCGQVFDTEYECEDHAVRRMEDGEQNR